MRHVPVAVTLLALATPAFAQKVTTVSDLTGKQVLVTMTDAVASRAVGEALALTTALDDWHPAVRHLVGRLRLQARPVDRPAGPHHDDLRSVVHRAGAHVGRRAAQHRRDLQSDVVRQGQRLFAVVPPNRKISAPSPDVARTAVGNLKLTERTVAITSTIGVTDNVDVAVVVPLVSVKIAGSTSVFNGHGVDTRLAETTSIFSGIGDVSALASYRFIKFKGQGLQDPGGVALLVDMRLPTGSRDNLRGLGVTRTFVGGVFSSGTTRIRPHATAGFEYLEQGDGRGRQPRSDHLRAPPVAVQRRD